MALLAFLATAEPASGQLRPITPVTRTVIPEPVIAKIQQGIRDHLRDPPSARFGSIIGGRDGAGTLHFCGWVNSKNSYGGYTGRKPFTGLVLDRITNPPHK